MNRDEMQIAVEQMIKGISYLIEQMKQQETKIYSGVVVSSTSNGKWNIQYNGETHAVNAYKVTPKVGQVVKVFIPENNNNLAFFI